uniref:Uncharacterized protein n=1 Tax=Panagrolaimus sp. ES5 TaxID=591445 RepID=A0AC34FPQ2_9BILA
MFGNQSLFWFDAAVLVWAGFVSSLALVIYNLVSNNLVADYTIFNEELKEASKAGQLAHADLLNNYGTRQLELLDLARFAYSQFSLLVTFTFVAGFITHALAGFIMRSFAEVIPIEMKISTLSFVFLALIIVQIFQLTKTATALYAELHKHYFN